jgi:hypothetical protein
MKVTKTDRVTALVDRTTTYDVSETIWDELTDFYGMSSGEALETLIGNDDAASVMCVSNIDEVLMVHNSEVYAQQRNISAELSPTKGAKEGNYE